MKRPKKSLPKKKMIVMVPYPPQGHVTPMLQLATAFVHREFHPVVVTPEFIHRKIGRPQDQSNGISFLSIPDGLEEDAPRDFFAVERAMENHMAIHLERLVCELMREEEGDEDGGGGGGGNVVCVVVDLLSSYGIEVAERCGVPVAGFWPVTLAAYRLIVAIPYMIRTSLISDTGNPQFKGSISIIPGQPKLRPGDLPWLIGTSAARVSRFKFWIRTLDRSRTLRWLLVNSSPKEEEEQECHDHEPKFRLTNACNRDEHSPFIFPVGPLSGYVLTLKNATFWEEDMTCLDWLDKQIACSVVYISFGSWVSPIGEEKINILALALEACKRPFIWVLGLSWREGLPKRYIERVSKIGKVVSWAPQVEVLRHEAVGCYFTHCGWNSTNEAIQCMKPLVCYPVAGDQFVNCAYIVEMWRIGVKIGGLGMEDVEEGFKKVIEDGKMKENLLRLKERIMGKEANLSSTACLTTFIHDLEKS
ncbi:hypothetical protein Vadar_008926 [Vaccinium darrowii]|uniref:Uncharacterized protein n=1 Tax=Vaccinium darrowii TaxID=229202 RepID=A0ACB7YMC0_9ERIC|nr:hypothetical protein Vadar_008926 [Vaccinium darrowii]